MIIVPTTTYLGNEPQRHEDEDISSMIDELQEITGEKWYVQTIYFSGPKRLFRKPKQIEHTSLYKHLHSIEYQVFTCVGTIREAKSYLFGALGAWDKINK